MIVFCWAEFPQYAARCIGAFVRATDERVAVVATRPKVPISDMEACAECPVVWISEDEPRSLAVLLAGIASSGTDDSKCPSVSLLVMSGWNHSAFNRFRNEVHASGGRVIAMLDNNLRLHGLRDVVRECLKSVKFRLTTRWFYDGYFVPGEESRKLLRFYGVPDERVASGVYAADETLFHPGEVLSQRSKKIVYVGQFIARKNVMRMCRAFLSAGGPAQGWSLELYGSGPLESTLSTLNPQPSTLNSRISIHSFLQPEELAAKYREARVFCLPSVEEHWGLVVHEAALSGCLLLLSDCVGARADFAGKDNVVAFDPFDERSLAAAFKRVFAMSDDALDAAGAESARRGRAGAGIAQFVAAMKAAAVAGAASC